MEIKEQLDFVEINGEKLYFYIQRKKVKNMNLKVHRDKKVTVSIPMRLPLETAKSFVRSKASWIKKQQDFYDTYIEQQENENIENGGIAYFLGEKYEVKIIPGTKNEFTVTSGYLNLYIKEKYINNVEYIRKTYNLLLKEYLFKILEPLILKYQQQMQIYEIPMPSVEIRQMKSTWGLCMPKRNKVKFNLNLIKKPISCIEYVVVHELAHFKHPNHSKDFYRFVEMFMPDWKERKKRLNGEGDVS